ncbi:MAG: membrane-bound lytic murein transglycosylase A [Alphaproteobacteria bacterium]|jgi:membrane-bound lytic murein transglycosylase A
MKNIFKLLTVLIVLQGCSKDPVSFDESSVDALDNWPAQNFTETYQSFMGNCKVLQKKKGEYLHKNKLFGTLENWKALCHKAEYINNGSIKAFFEDNFALYKVESQKPSLFTGYYTPTLKGSLLKTAQFNTPLYQKPTDLYSADLGQFYPELKGKIIIARLDENNKKFKPYYKRHEIDAFYAEAKPFIWLKSPIDSFFLHIQGSGYIELPDERVVHVAYNGSNGHGYKAIGRTLIENGWMKKEDVTMQSLYQWLESNPEKQAQVFHSNPRYIFFRESNGKTTGSLGVELTEQGSLAVDPAYIPLGIPAFVETTLTYDKTSFQKMLYTQDTGAAIKGGVRGDIFFGKGKKAELLSGAQNNEGSLYVFVPKR